MHEKNLIHTNIEPSNFVIGLNEKTNILHLVGMGFAERSFDGNKKFDKV